MKDLKSNGILDSLVEPLKKHFFGGQIEKRNIFQISVKFLYKKQKMNIQELFVETLVMINLGNNLFLIYMI